MKVTHFGLENGGCLKVEGLTPATQMELVDELNKVGGDVQVVLMKAKYKAVKKVK